MTSKAKKVKAWILLEKEGIVSAGEDRDKLRYMASVRKKYGVRTKIYPCTITYEIKNN